MRTIKASFLYAKTVTLMKTGVPEVDRVFIFARIAEDVMLRSRMPGFGVLRVAGRKRPVVVPVLWHLGLISEGLLGFNGLPRISLD